MLILIRLAGEVATKSRRVRARFQRRLVGNIKDALESAGLEYRVSDQWSRLFVEIPDSSPDDAQAGANEGAEQAALAVDILARVFGIRSLSMVEHRCRPELEEIVRVGRAAYTDLVRGKTFAVRANRTGEQPFRSQDIHVQLGAALDAHAKVNLDNPDVTVQVEVRPDEALFFSRRVPGPGGLPVAVEGRAVTLMSGGFDSAVAAWLMLKRGVNLDYVMCNLAGDAYERSVLRVVKLLADTWSSGSYPRLHVVDFQPVVTALRRDVKHQYVQVVLKRLMYRVGQRVAEQLGGQAIVTGESVGQVSSQTLANLRAIEEVATLPVLRPLVGMDKEEIIALSRRIGTYPLSATVQEYCALVTAHPVTAAHPEAARRAEAPLDLAILDPLIDQRKVINVRTLDATELVLPYLYTDEIDGETVVIDCRPAGQFLTWHCPGAVHHEMDELVMNYRRLDRARRYVLYCPFGLQSAVVAEKMQQAGYEAYSFKGGTRALRNFVQSQPVED